MPWVGLLSPLPTFCGFRTHGPRMRLDDLLTTSDDSSLVFLHPPPRSIDLPVGAGARGQPTTISLWFCCTHHGQRGLRRRPSCHDVSGPTTPSRSSVQGIDPVELTGPTAPASSSPSSPTLQTMTPFSDCICTRTRRRSAIAAGKAPPAVDYGLGPGGGPRPPSRRVKTPPRALLPRPTPPATATPTLADSLVRTLPLPSNHDHAEPLGTPLLQLTPFPSDTPTTPTRSDALDDAAELMFAYIGRTLFPFRLKAQTARRADVPRHETLHLNRPAIGPATRLLGMLPLAQASPPLRHPGTGG